MRTASAFALLTIFSALGAAQDRMAETLRKGVVEEEAQRNPTAAIQSYQSVVTQYDEARHTAATAIFRMAECYRKLGKDDQAKTAYQRVVREFADQSKLAEQSQNQLSNTYKLPQQQAAGAVDPATAEARRQYRALLEEEIRAFQSNVNFIQQQYQLGAIAGLDTNNVQADLARLKSRLAAFDAGLVPPVPAGTRTPAVLAARAQYRALLLTQVDYAAKAFVAAQQKYKLGTESNQYVTDAQIKLLEARLELAALDAGLAQPPSAAARQAQ